MGTPNVVDPGGVAWNVRRRWYPWRRNMSLRELWSHTQSETPKGAESEPVESEDSSLPRNIVAKVLLYPAVVLFLVISVIEPVLEIVVMAITLARRVLGAARWPVEIDRQGKHFATREAKDYASAGELRDGLVAQIQAGVLASDQQSSAA